MRSNGLQVLLADNVFDINKKLKQIESISLESVKAVIDDVLDFDKASCSYVGREAGLDPLALLRE